MTSPRKERDAVLILNVTVSKHAAIDNIHLQELYVTKRNSIDGVALPELSRKMSGYSTGKLICFTSMHK
jgi:hypothetical protein